MRRGGLFWGSALLLLGALLLLNTLGILPMNAWKIFWPLMLILVGVWFLVAPHLMKRDAAVLESVAIPLNNAPAARIKLRHGAGTLDLHASANDTLLVDGTCSGGVEQDVEVRTELTRVKLKVPDDMVMWFPGMHTQGIEWNLGLNRLVPIQLDVKAGAGRYTLDLSALRVVELKMETGASETAMTLPSSGQCNARLEVGAASLNLTVPEGMAARFQIKTGVANIQVNPARFPFNGVVYQSPDYETSTNRADVFLEGGVGSITIQ